MKLFNVFIFCILFGCGSSDSRILPAPSEIPTATPTQLPTEIPTLQPKPTVDVLIPDPTESPTAKPELTPEPSVQPTLEPTAEPTLAPLTPTPEPTARILPAIKFMVASDIQEGSWSSTVRFEKTAQVIEKENPDYVISAGDLSNSRGTANDYVQFNKAWGRFKNKILAVPGNHDYMTDKANPFFDYFNGVGSVKGLPEVGRTGARGKGYFAIDIGAWTIIGLNFYANGKSYTAGDAQMVWLGSVMKNKPKGRPVLFFSHPPRYTRVDNGGYENAGKISVVWDVMLKYAPDVKIYIAGHSNGNYERWQPMDNKKKASTSGIRSFLVATGGTSPYKGGVAGDLLESTAQLFGAMKLVLRPDGYDWDYKPIAGYSFTDKGSFNF